jgi:hypothetical protein
LLNKKAAYMTNLVIYEIKKTTHDSVHIPKQYFFLSLKSHSFFCSVTSKRVAKGGKKTLSIGLLFAVFASAAID